MNQSKSEMSLNFWQEKSYRMSLALIEVTGEDISIVKHVKKFDILKNIRKKIKKKNSTSTSNINNIQETLSIEITLILSAEE